MWEVSNMQKTEQKTEQQAGLGMSFCEEEGIVVDQDVTPDIEITTGTQVRLKVSKGTPYLILPSYDKKTEKEYLNELAAMEAEGIICGYHTLINWEKTGIEKVTALIEVRVTPQRGMGFDKVAERIYNYPEVNSVYLISGGFDFMVTLEGKTLREVSEFVSDKLSPLDSVLSTKTNFILKKYKDHGTIMAEQRKDERELVSL